MPDGAGKIKSFPSVRTPSTSNNKSLIFLARNCGDFALDISCDFNIRVSDALVPKFRCILKPCQTVQQRTGLSIVERLNQRRVSHVECFHRLRATLMEC